MSNGMGKRLVRVGGNSTGGRQQRSVGVRKYPPIINQGRSRFFQPPQAILMNSPRYFALIPAAGVGARLGASQPKQYLSMAGKPMLSHVLETFSRSSEIAHVYVVVSAEDGYIDALMAAAHHLKERVTVLRVGGETRRESVLNGLKETAEQIAAHDWVLVHDAARPGLTPELISDLIDALKNDPVGGLLALPVVDTLKRCDSNQVVEATVSREQLWAAQTPQMFRYETLLAALVAAPDVTDESGAVERMGLRPTLVEGSPRNLKVTLPHDIALIELYLKGNA